MHDLMLPKTSTRYRVLGIYILHHSHMGFSLSPFLRPSSFSTLTTALLSVLGLMHTIYLVTHANATFFLFFPSLALSTFLPFLSAYFSGLVTANLTRSSRRSNLLACVACRSFSHFREKAVVPVFS